MNNEEKELKEYISVYDYAKFIGKSKQHVYNMVNDGSLPSVYFRRGTKIGKLVEKPLGFDEWEETLKMKSDETQR